MTVIIEGEGKIILLYELEISRGIPKLGIPDFCGK